MQAQELIEKYKNIKLYQRLLICMNIIAAYCGYEFWYNYEYAIQEKTNKQFELKATQTRYNRENKKIAKLPTLTKDIKELNVKFNIIKNKLPNKFYIEKILKKTSYIAEKTGIVMQVFDPGEEVLSNTEQKYVTRPISISIKGSFKQIVAFINSIINLDILVNVSSYDLVLVENKQQEDNIPIESIQKDKTQMLSLTNTKERKKTYLETSLLLTIYRSYNK
jgi:Tfp pilus assembly protein PilO